MALAQPVDPVEQDVERQISAALCASLAMERADAALQARRWVLFHRELLLHELLIIQMPVAELAQVVDAVALPDISGCTGTILLSAHFSLYSSLLWLRLTREALLERSAPLTVLFDSGADRRWQFPRRRLPDLDQGRLLDTRLGRLLDLAEHGPLVAARTLVRRLRRGENVLLMCDPAPESRAGRGLRVTLGSRTLRLPVGPAAVAASARAPALPLWIQPEGDAYAVHAGEHAAVEAAAQALLESTAARQPALWEGWVRFP